MLQEFRSEVAVLPIEYGDFEQIAIANGFLASPGMNPRAMSRHLAESAGTDKFIISVTVESIEAHIDGRRVTVDVLVHNTHEVVATWRARYEQMERALVQLLPHMLEIRGLA